MSIPTIRWGIAGPGGISKQFAKDLAYAEGAELVAVAGRSLDKAESFAKDFRAARAYGSFDRLAADPEVDIVYVGTLHPAHHDNVLTFLRAGKAVLCEKPFTMNASEAEEIIRYAKENRIFLMEAMWTRYLPPIRQVRQWLAEGVIGDVRMVKADFGFDLGWQPESRLLDPKLGGGALLDVGIYPVSFASMIYGARPRKIMSSARIGTTGVDEQFSILMEYEEGQIAALNGAVQLEMVNDAYIIGTKGHIHIPMFLAARSASLHVRGQDPIRFEDDRQASGYAFEAEEAMACLRAGRTESPVMPLGETLEIMSTLDRIRQQWNLRYPFE
ncbi:Gfo/Idh/MocA family protein [Cohnella cholangitidis]|uniref:Gfo/Idh/MocA family oxidoreductase n=1 Tax=Cohnella cholangitidis TaxID=2598458 RepID=A0A7G5C3J4_9BACL|nr:Gfo/Idh/MocA family oxidoreductase [Cohnella cholangitidis]QMV43778.1 Gfo/Idh/MocA family oxidoreductase [Cohnella cholangitidis]